MRELHDSFITGPAASRCFLVNPQWVFSAITYPKEGAQKVLDGKPVTSLDELKSRLGR